MFTLFINIFCLYVLNEVNVHSLTKLYFTGLSTLTYLFCAISIVDLLAFLHTAVFCRYKTGTVQYIHHFV